jgi:hypothetical protein
MLHKLVVHFQRIRTYHVASFFGNLQRLFCGETVCNTVRHKSLWGLSLAVMYGNVSYADHEDLSARMIWAGGI